MANTQVKSKNQKTESLATKQLLQSIIAILIALFIGVLLIAIDDPNNISVFFKSLWNFSFGSTIDFANFLANLSWMIPLGLALAVSFRIGLFNIGAAGQMLGGGFGAYLFATSVNIPQIGWMVTILFGAAIGMFIALIIGFLKTQFNINEVISSIMINWVIFYLVRNASPGASQTWGSIYGLIQEGNNMKQEWLLNIFDAPSYTKLNVGVIVALALIPLFMFLYSHTSWGFKQDLLGGNKDASDFIGINKDAEIIKSIMISGALAGTAGAIYFVGFHDPYSLYSVMNKYSNEIPGIFFNGITISLLGFNSTLGVLLASILLSILYPAGSQSLDEVIGDKHIVDIMIAVMIIMMARAHYSIYYKQKRVKVKSQTNNNSVEKIEEEKNGALEIKTAPKSKPTSLSFEAKETLKGGDAVLAKNTTIKGGNSAPAKKTPTKKEVTK